ncbi:MAG: gamma-glutamylcyclotransferase [Pseudomonadota bacterium]
MIPDSAYRHHPRLRGKIEDPATSFFRTFRPSDADQWVADQNLPPDWRYTEEQIEAMRLEALAGHSGDLWVFAYGSLMWNPGVWFTEVVRARVTGMARKFCLVEPFGGRGTSERPGIMAALDAGPHCDGLAFRLAAGTLTEESRIIFYRELLAPAYETVWLTAETKLGPIQVLSFAADHGTDLIQGDLPYEDVVRYAATGEGVLGTSLEYLENLVEHFETLRIEDADVSQLLVDARSFRAKHTL